MFFGARRCAADFRYAEELDSFLDSVALTRLSLSFSRDGAPGSPKDYVQQRMWEHSVEIFDWLQGGAHLYVCGDAKRMAKDVDTTVRELVARCGGMDAVDAHTYVNELVKCHRYVRDVY